MTPKRYAEIEMREAVITDDERREGWHFCHDWDEMLVGPGMPEMECCECCVPVD